MKIAAVNICDNGSTGKIACDILESLGDVEKFLFVGHKISTKNYVKQIQTKLDYRKHQLVSMIFDLENIGSKKTTKRLLEQLAIIKPDIIHLHNIHGYYLNYEMLFEFIKKNKIKTIWTLHDCWSFTGRCAYFDCPQCKKWQSGCGGCKAKFKYPRTLFFDHSAKQYICKKAAFTGVENLVIVSPSKWLASLVKQSFLKDYTTIVINNGIDLANFSICDNKSFDSIIDRSKKIILGVANEFSERKGFGDFIKLSTIISSEYQIVLVGVTRKQIEQLPKNIVGLTRTENQKQLAELYSLANVFVNLTYEDNFPTVNIESLACGTPVITYQTGGSVEVIENDNGKVVPQGDYAKVWDCISNMHVTSDQREIISKNAKIKYSRSKMADQYNLLINDKSSNRNE